MGRGLGGLGGGWIFVLGVGVGDLDCGRQKSKEPGGLELSFQ